MTTKNVLKRNHLIKIATTYDTNIAPNPYNTAYKTFSC